MAKKTIAVITDRAILKFLWLAIALSCPLFSVEFMRYNNEALRIHIALPMLLQGVIIASGILLCLGKGSIKLGHFNERGLMGILAMAVWCFLMWHIVSLFKAENQSLALREIIKLVLDIISLWCVILFFPLEESFLERFWQIVIWSSAAMMAFLVYKYLFVFNSPFLGNGLEEATREGRNQLTWYLSFIMPMAIAYLMCSKKKVKAALPLLILTIAWIYGESRGAWISVLVGCLFMLASFGSWRGKFKRMLTLVLGIVLIVGVLFWCGSFFVDTTEIKDRALYLIKPNEYSDLNSYEDRWTLTIDTLRLFTESPLIGVGLTNAATEMVFLRGNVSHNDYVSILADLGIIGLALFGIIWFIVIKQTLSQRSIGSGKTSWVSMGSLGGLVAGMVELLSYNAYTTPWLWMFLGLAFMSGESLMQFHKRFCPGECLNEAINSK